MDNSIPPDQGLTSEAPAGETTKGEEASQDLGFNDSASPPDDEEPRTTTPPKTGQLEHENQKMPDTVGVEEEDVVEEGEVTQTPKRPPKLAPRAQSQQQQQRSVIKSDSSKRTLSQPPSDAHTSAQEILSSSELPTQRKPGFEVQKERPEPNDQGEQIDDDHHTISPSSPRNAEEPNNNQAPDGAKTAEEGHREGEEEEEGGGDESMDWEALENRFEAEMKACREKEAELRKEWEKWAQVSLPVLPTRILSQRRMTIRRKRVWMFGWLIDRDQHIGFPRMVSSGRCSR